MAVSPPLYEAVLFDALGTLVRLEPPWPLLAGALATRYGIEVTEDEAREGMRAEMAYYLEHHVEGRDPDSLADLRARCARVLREALPATASLSEEELTEALLDSLRFVPFPDAATVLGTLRATGIRTAVVSNWDYSLRNVLAELGLAGLLDAVVTSAEAGSRKPDPGIFETALAAVQCPPERAVFVGDSPAVDIAGGRAAGIRSILVDRSASVEAPDDVERVFTLDNVPALMTGSPIV